MIRRVAAFALLLLTAACAQPPKTVAVASAPPPPAALPLQSVPVPPAVVIPPAPPRGEPTDYLNLPQANLRAQLGQPQFTRQDGSTEMWRYDGTQCRAFFFFYGPKGTETVRHVETLPAGATSAADPLCLSALRSARRAS